MPAIIASFSFPPLLLFLFLLFSHLPSCLCLQRGIPPPVPALLPGAPPPIPASRTAYVAIHTHTGTVRDDYQHDGILTMFGTLAETTNISRSRIVLVTHNTPAALRSAYSAASLQVLEIPDPGFHDQCEPKFNRIHLWDSRLLPYDRVLFLDADVLVVYGIDWLFLCGDLCIVYSSVQHFTDSLMVVRPSAAVHSQLLQAYAQLDLGHALLTDIWCPEESWHFFLRFFGDVEAAPLFNPALGQHPLPQSEADRAAFPSSSPAFAASSPTPYALARLSSSVCLNAMMWYEFFSYRLLRGPAFRNWTDADGIPAFSLGWTGLKPFNWAPGLFFNLIWLWHDERDRVLKRGYAGTWLQWGVVCALLAWTGAEGVRLALAWLMRERKKGETGWRLLNAVRGGVVAVMGSKEEERRRKSTGDSSKPILQPSFSSSSLSSFASSTSSSPSVFSIPYYWLPKVGVLPVAVVLAFVMINVNGWPLYWTIRRLTPPHIAYTILCTAHCLLTYIDLQLLRYAFHFSPQQQPAASCTEEQTHLLAAVDDLETQPALSSSSSPSSSDPPAAASSSLSSLSSSSSLSSVSARPFSYHAALSSAPSIHLSPLSLLSVVVWEYFTWLSMRFSVYGEFVVKMFAIFPIVAFLFIAHVNVWRAALGQMKDRLDRNARGAAGDDEADSMRKGQMAGRA